MKRGFTLIELLIVVAIIAILAAIAVPNFLEAQTRAKVSRCKADMRTLVTAIEAYGVDNNKYAPMADRHFTDVSVAGPNFHSRMPTFYTTPIAYVTSIMLDPFVDKRTATFTSTAYPAESMVGFRYVYYESVMLSSDPPIGFGDPWDKLTEWVGAWNLMGYGPDGLPSVPGTAAPDRGTLHPYDATNGTVSKGNIVRCQKNTASTPIHPRTGTFGF